MLDININDVLMILQNMVPQFIVLGIVFALAVIAMVACYKLSKPVKYAVRTNAVVAMIAALVIFVNYAALGQFSSMLSLVTGDGTISSSTQEEAGELANTIMQEGIVLLKNDDNFLPTRILLPPKSYNKKAYPALIARLIYTTRKNIYHSEYNT